MLNHDHSLAKTCVRRQKILFLQSSLWRFPVFRSAENDPSKAFVKGRKTWIPNFSELPPPLSAPSVKCKILLWKDLRLTDTGSETTKAGVQTKNKINPTKASRTSGKIGTRLCAIQDELLLQFSSLDTMLAILCPIFVAFSFLLEASRLYFGYYGNLFENVSLLHNTVQ